MREKFEQRKEQRYSEDQPRDKDGKFASGASNAIDALNEKHPQNPDNPKERLFMVAGKRAGSFEVSERDGRLRIRSIQADAPHSGIGTKILNSICSAADKEGVTCELTASSYGSHALSTDELKVWYGSHGFKNEEGYDAALGYMVRIPEKEGRCLLFRYSDPPRDTLHEWIGCDLDGTLAVADSSAASGTDRNVSASVAEVPTPADPSADPYKRVCEFFSTTDANEEQWKKDLRDNMMELFVDAFRDDDAKRIGESVPQSEYKPLGIGYGPLGGQQFPEACAFELSEIGPQGEPVYRYSEDQPRDPDGKFASGGAGRKPVDIHFLPVVKTEGDLKHGELLKFVKSPFPKLNTKVDAPSGNDISKAIEKKVSLSTLHGTQSLVMVHGMEKPRDLSDDLPLVVHSNGVNYIQDGHHRLAKDYFDGKDVAKVRYVDLDAKKGRSLLEHTEERYSEDQPRDPDGKFASGSGLTDDKGKHTIKGANDLLDRLDVKGVKVIGSVARKGESEHDLDLMAPSKAAADSVKDKMEKQGFEWQGNSTLSPKEAQAYKGPKTFDKNAWSIMDHYKDAAGHNVEVWHSERSAVRQPAFDFAAVPLYGPQGEPVYEPRAATVRAEKAPVTLSRTYQRKELKIRTGPMCYRSADGEVIWC